MPNRYLHAVVVSTALFFSAAATATVVPRLDLHDLVQSSETIVHARVVRHWSAWDASHRFIWTHYEIQVQDGLKGTAAATTVISEPGGIVGGAAMKVAGVPEHRDGEEMVVFLHRTPVGYWRCYGLEQGKFAVLETAAGQKRVRANLGGVERATAPDGRAMKTRTAAPSLDSLNGTTLADFKARVRREVAR